MKHGHVPIRTCKACGRKAPKQEFERLVVQQGQLKAAEKLEVAGPGIYCCRETACRDRLYRKSEKRKRKIARSALQGKEDGSNQ